MLNESFIINFAHVSAATIIIPFIFLILKRKAFNKQLKALFIYICTSILFELLGLISLNTPPFNYYITFSFVVIETGIIFYLFCTKIIQPFFKKSIITIYIIFLFTALLLILMKNLPFAESIIFPLQSTLILILSIFFFFKIFTDSSLQNITDYPSFWFNSAFLLYFGTNLFLYLFYTNIKLCNLNLIYLVGCLPLIMGIIYNSLLAVGIWKIKLT
jgi:hypothetical protein